MFYFAKQRERQPGSAQKAGTAAPSKEQEQEQGRLAPKRTDLLSPRRREACLSSSPPAGSLVGDRNEAPSGQVLVGVFAEVCTRFVPVTCDGPQGGGARTAWRRREARLSLRRARPCQRRRGHSSGASERLPRRLSELACLLACLPACLPACLQACGALLPLARCFPFPPEELRKGEQKNSACRCWGAKGGCLER